MTSRGFALQLSATTRRGLTLAWAALFALSMLFTYAANAAPVRAAGHTPAANPDLQPGCGIKVIMILDASGSIDTTEQGQVRTAATAFLDALQDTGSQVAMVEFSESADAPVAYTLVTATSTGAGGVFANYLSASNLAGPQYHDDRLVNPYTNWSAGFDAANALATADLVVFMTDGDPNRPTEATAMPAAITSSDTTKNKPSHIFGIGVGTVTGDSLTRLQTVTGPHAYNGSNFLAADYDVTSDFSGLSAALAAVAHELCPGTLTVEKVIVGNGSASPDDFSFTINDGAPISFEEDGQNDVNVGVGTYSVTELDVDGYTTTYENCSGLQITSGGFATCTITNTYEPPPPDKGTLIVKKVVDGGTSASADFLISVKQNGTNVTGSPQVGNADPGTSYTLAGGSYVVSESSVANYVASFSGNCAQGVIEVTNGQSVTCTITNTYVPPRVVVLDPVTMSIVKTNNSTGAVVPGGPVGFTLTLGVSPTSETMAGVNVSDQLPAGIGNATGISNGGTYSAGTNKITWTGLTVSNGQKLTYTATVSGSATPGNYVNTASITQGGLCPAQAACTATSTVKVGASQQVLAATGRPVITLPPTDGINSGDQSSSSPGLGLMLALFAIAGIGLVAGYIVPKTSRLRREEVRRR